MSADDAGVRMKSRLLTLPPEIRCQIWGDVVRPTAWRSDSVSKGYRFHHVGLLRVCRQVSGEVDRELHRQNQFVTLWLPGPAENPLGFPIYKVLRVHAGRDLGLDGTRLRVTVWFDNNGSNLMPSTILAHDLEGFCTQWYHYALNQ